MAAAQPAEGNGRYRRPGVGDSSGRHPVLGGYRLEEELGAGSTGTVWRARRAGPISQVVAVKRLRVGAAGTDVDRLRREAEILAQLDHPHIVRVLEVVDDAGPAVVMQYAPGVAPGPPGRAGPPDAG